MFLVWVCFRNGLCIHCTWYNTCIILFFFKHEAAKVIQDAIWQFKDTPEEVRVMVANADLALAKDNIDAALNALGNIMPGESIYIHAKEKMACIYLERQRNKNLYIACYR